MKFKLKSSNYNCKSRQDQCGSTESYELIPLEKRPDRLDLLAKTISDRVGKMLIVNMLLQHLSI